jgi:hypothetical protein
VTPLSPVRAFAPHPTLVHATLTHRRRADNRIQYQAGRQAGVPSSFRELGALDLDFDYTRDDAEGRLHGTDVFDDDDDELPTPRPGSCSPPDSLDEVVAHLRTVGAPSFPEMREVPVSEYTPLLLPHRGSRATLRRRVSAVSIAARPPGKSTFRQTVRRGCVRSFFFARCAEDAPAL